MSERWKRPETLSLAGMVLAGVASAFAWGSCLGPAWRLVEAAEPRLHPPFARGRSDGAGEAIAKAAPPAKAQEPGGSPTSVAQPPPAPAANAKPTPSKPAAVVAEPAAGSPPAAKVAPRPPAVEKKDSSSGGEKPAAATAAPKEPAPPPKDVELGSLTLVANAEAEVWIDGRLVGKAPVEGRQVPEGRHRVRFDCIFPEGKLKGAERKVEVQAFSEVSVEYECPQQLPSASEDRASAPLEEPAPQREQE